jgi:dienelactone hydrolase
MPPGVQRPPAIVLIHGSHGPSREDLRGPATIFARNGIAALIYDKRDLGSDQQQPHRYSFRELADDARAAVNLLHTRSDIDAAHIGIFGISEGGWLAPLVAENNSNVAFVIAIAAPAVSYAEVEDTVTHAGMQKEGASETEIATALGLLHRTNKYVRHGGDAASLTRDLETASRERWARNIALPRAAPSPREIHADVRWRELDYEPAEHWQHVHAPVFAAWGGDDEHPVAESVAAMRAAFARAGNANVSLSVYPHATHELLVTPRRDVWQWPRLAPHFIDDMLRWTAAHAR